MDNSTLLFGILQLSVAYVGYVLYKKVTSSQYQGFKADNIKEKKTCDVMKEADKQLLGQAYNDRKDPDDENKETSNALCVQVNDEEEVEEDDFSLTKPEEYDHELAGDKSKWGLTIKSKWGTPSSMENKRNLIINEIIVTEQSYVSSLRKLHELFIQPMTASTAERTLGVTDKDINSLSFTSISMILQLHESLLPQLMATDSIGEVFLKLGDFLKMYTAFVNAYDKVLSTLSSLGKVKKFQSYAEEIRRKEPSASLESFLIMPVQRVPRYLLLLSELKKHTPEFHSDYDNLTASVEHIQKIASHINESKQRFENANQLLKLQNRLQGYDSSILLPYRRLIREGRLRTKALARFAVPRQTGTLLFNDMVMFVSKSFKFRGIVQLSGCKVQINDDSDSNAFSLLDSHGKQWRLVAGSAAEKQDWCSDITYALENLNPPSPSAIKQE